MKTRETLVLIAVAAGLYLAYRFKRPLDTAEQWAADLWVDLTSDGPVTVTGAVILPSGQAIPLSSVYVNERFHFDYGGVEYFITGRNAQNNYNTIAV